MKHNVCIVASDLDTNNNVYHLFVLSWILKAFSILATTTKQATKLRERKV